MKTRLHTLLIIFLLSLSVNAQADPIGPMNYQGRLLDNNGIPVTGTYTFKVRIYDALTAGTKNFEETHSNVSVEDGVYSFLVGQGVVDYGSWDIALWNDNNLYLEVQVGAETLTPRHRLAAAPFAFQANLALTTNNALALGGKTAAEYDNILADICASGKGKWLELANSGKGECLGIGSSFTGTAVNWNTLTASSDFSDLDLTKADVSGINFSGADLTNTKLHKTTYKVQGMSGANLTRTDWDGAIATDVAAYTASASTNLTGATFQNMSMAKWNLSSVTVSNLNMLSAAVLTGASSAAACPAGFPAGWQCRDEALAATNNFFLLGPGANFSAGSAASSFKFGSSYLNLGKDALNNSNLTGAGFVGNVINQNFINVTLTNVHFDYATLTNNTFDSGTFLQNTTFINAKIDRMVMGSTVDIDSADFTDAELNYVGFQLALPMSNGVFLGATLRGVSFNSLNNSNFTNAVLDNVSINGDHYNNNFTSVRFYNGFRHGLSGTTPNTTPVYSPRTYQGGSTFANVTFRGGIISGDFFGVIFTGTTVFDSVMMSHIQLCMASIPLTDTSPAHEDLKTVTWGAGFVCPSGFYSVSGTAAGCNLSSQTYMTAAVSSTSCQTVPTTKVP